MRSVRHMSDPRTRYLLSEDDIPTHWVNVLPDLPGDPLPPLSPATQEPAGPADLGALFPPALIEQEVSPEPLIAIPDAVRSAYRLWRPTPLHRAWRLEQALGTPARIFYKYEGGSPAGSHKPNTAVAQAHANAEAGVRKLATETRAGHWGSSLPLARTPFGRASQGWVGRSRHDPKPHRPPLVQNWGPRVHPP